MDLGALKIWNTVTRCDKHALLLPIPQQTNPSHWDQFWVVCPPVWYHWKKGCEPSALGEGCFFTWRNQKQLVIFFSNIPSTELPLKKNDARFGTWRKEEIWWFSDSQTSFDDFVDEPFSWLSGENDGRCSTALTADDGLVAWGGGYPHNPPWRWATFAYEFGTSGWGSKQLEWLDFTLSNGRWKDEIKWVVIDETSFFEIEWYE